MAYNIDQNTGDIVIDGWENGIAPSPYKGIANMRNVNTSYYPGVAYVNYRRQATTLTQQSNIDSYSEINYTGGGYPLYSGGTQQYLGQVFYNILSSCNMFLKRGPWGTILRKTGIRN